MIDIFIEWSQQEDLKTVVQTFAVVPVVGDILSFAELAGRRLKVLHRRLEPNRITLACVLLWQGDDIDGE